MENQFISRAKKGLVYTLITYLLLVAPHLGEFWPFSIFPMFSQAGNPWTRALVRQMPDIEHEQDLWRVVSIDDLPGDPLLLEEEGINQNDVANFVSKTRVWDHQRLNGLGHLLDAGRMEHPLLVYKVRGRLVQNTVETTAEPLILFARDTTFTAPSIKISPSVQP